MSVSGPVNPPNQVSRLHDPFSGGRSREYPMPYHKPIGKFRLPVINTQTHLHQNPGSSSAGSSNRDQSATNSSISGRPYDPVHDTHKSPTLQPENMMDVRVSDSNMQGQSPEPARSPQSHGPLPSISQLGVGFTDTSRSSERRSPPPAFSARSPMSLSQPFSTPYPSIASQSYHSVYSDPSPSASHLTQSPRDQYSQPMSSGSPSQYDRPTFKDTPGQTPLSASTQATFSPTSTDRSPMTDQRAYSQDDQSPSVPPGGSAAGGYPCLHETCVNRPAFHTQYLLHSHQNVHKPDRPYYCEFPDCSRSRNGKPNSGFKRKNELIRHQLVHNSPGYACPFCPDRDHKYPRPDNLQRHVKVHHADKNKDDPLLRNILAKRADSDISGRRRRVNSTS